MVAAVGRNDTADFSDFEGEGSVFEGLLHVSAVEEAEVSSLLAAGALRKGLGDFSEEGGIGLHLLEELLSVLERLFGRAGDLLVAEGVEGTARFSVLLEDVCAPH